MVVSIDLLVILILWIGFAFLADIAARNRGHSAGVFFFLSLVMSPLFGLVAALVIKVDLQKIEEARLSTGHEKRCPYCAEIIKAEAKVCRYCNSDVSAVDAPVVKRDNPEIIIERKTIFGDDR
jgi:hypothetical protein